MFYKKNFYKKPVQAAKQLHLQSSKTNSAPFKQVIGLHADCVVVASVVWFWQDPHKTGPKFEHIKILNIK